MHYDIALANRVRAALAACRGVVEKEAFGGLGFILHDHMFCAVVGDALMVRLEADRYEEALQQPEVSAMDVTGRATPGHVYVTHAALGSDEALQMWIARGVQCVSRMMPARTPPVSKGSGGKTARPRVEPGSSPIRRIPRSGPSK